MTTVRELIPKKTGKLPKSVGPSNWPFNQSMEEFFENFFNRAWMEPFGFRRPIMRELENPLELRYPLVDLIDHDEELVVRAELPGVKKDEIELTISPHVTRFVRLYDRREVYETLSERLKPRKVTRPHE